MPCHGERRQRGRASPRYYAQLYESAFDEDVDVEVASVKHTRIDDSLSTLMPKVIPPPNYLLHLEQQTM
jgi:hypothetical protein